MTFDVSDWTNRLEALHASGSLPHRTWTLHVSGLGVPVTFSMASEDVPDSLHVYGADVPVAQEVSLAAGCADALWVDEASGAVIFTCGRYGVGHSYAVSPDGSVDALAPGASTTALLYRASDGALRFRRVNNRMEDAMQSGALSVATGYDMFWRSSGAAAIEHGRIVLGEEDARYVIRSAFDLDGEFVKTGRSLRYGSIEEVFAENRQKQQLSHS